MKKKIIIITGDPNSINSEIIFKSWKKLNTSIKKRIYLISNFNLIKDQFKKLNYSVNIQKVKNINEDTNGYPIKVIDIVLKYTDCFKVPTDNAANFIIDSLNYAHKLGVKNNVSGIINCAINKSLLKKDNIGVTEYLASKCGLKNNTEVMLIRNENLSVSPITTHVDIKDISKKIKITSIINKIKTIDKWFKRNLYKNPKIAILGLNPHNAELRKNSEEVKIIIPAILKLKNKGFKVEGPLVSDTIFVKDYKKYDVIVGMFHDQVLSPFKALFKFDAVNTTLGLKYLRVSPDHGTAYNLIKKNKADPTSLIKCIEFINKFGK